MWLMILALHSFSRHVYDVQLLAVVAFVFYSRALNSSSLCQHLPVLPHAPDWSN